MSYKDYNRSPLRKTTEDESNEKAFKSLVSYDERVGNAIVRARNWRMVAFFCLLTTLACLGIIFYLSSRATLIPYVIEVDSTSGMSRAIGTANEARYDPKDAEIKYYLAQFVNWTNSVPLDPVIYKKYWSQAYAYMTKDAANKMSVYMSDANQIGMLGKQTVTPKITSIVQQSKGTWMVRWTNEVFDLNGGNKKAENYTGLFTIDISPPKVESEILVNPLGIYVKDFNWTKDSN